MMRFCQASNEGDWTAD